MTATVLDSPLVARPPKELVDFAKRQVLNEKLNKIVERRSELREWMVVPVLARPVDEDLRPIDSPLHVVTRDLSPKGTCLVHFDPIWHEYLALHMCLANTNVDLVARVIWCKPLGPFYCIGVEFIAKLNAPPWLRKVC